MVPDPVVVFAVTGRPIVRRELQHVVAAHLEVEHGPAPADPHVTDQLSPVHGPGALHEVRHVGVLGQDYLPARQTMPDQHDVAPTGTIVTGRHNRAGGGRVDRLTDV